jgi:hypothetical protein
LKADEKRSHRLNALAKLWHSSGKNEDVVMERALQIGVTKTTAKSYLDAIKRRYPK